MDTGFSCGGGGGGVGDENVSELRWLIWHTLNVPKTIGLHT